MLGACFRQLWGDRRGGEGRGGEGGEGGHMYRRGGVDTAGEGVTRTAGRASSTCTRAHMFNDIYPVPASGKLALCIWMERWKEGRTLTGGGTGVCDGGGGGGRLRLTGPPG